VDVGCGPGGLTRELARRLGAGSVSAIDPSPPFVAACRERVPGAEVVEGVAEALPFADGAFDSALSSLVVGFMSDAQQGDEELDAVRAAVRDDLEAPDGPFTLPAVAWAARGAVPA